MARELSVKEAVQRAQQLQEDRIGAIRGLAEARQNLADTRDEAARRLAEVQRETAELIAAAEREDVKRYAAAQSAGWSADELRKVGYPEPEKKTRVRKRQARKSPAPSAPTTNDGDASGDAEHNAAA